MKSGMKVLISPLDVAPDAVLVDLKNEARALPVDTPAVNTEREAFIRFVQTAP
jgi:hypothetical protein